MEACTLDWKVTGLYIFQSYLYHKFRWYFSQGNVEAWKDWSFEWEEFGVKNSMHILFSSNTFLMQNILISHITNSILFIPQASWDVSASLPCFWNSPSLVGMWANPPMGDYTGIIHVSLAWRDLELRQTLIRLQNRCANLGYDGLARSMTLSQTPRQGNSHTRYIVTPSHMGEGNGYTH